MKKSAGLQDLLGQLSNEQLIQTLLEYAQGDAAFTRKFFEFVQTKLTAEDGDGIRDEVDALMDLERSYGSRYERYYETDWDGIVEGVNRLFDKASAGLKAGLIRQAAGAGLQWLSVFSDSLKDDEDLYYDADCDFDGACERAAALIDAAMSHPKADAKFKASVIKELKGIAPRFHEMEGWFEGLSIDILTERMQTMTMKPEKALEVLDDLEAKHDIYGSQGDALIIQKYRVLRELGREQEAWELIKEQVGRERVCEFIVEECLREKKYDTAVELLENAITISPLNTLQWLDKEAEIYRELSDVQGLVKTYRRKFICSGGSLDSYSELKKLIPAGEWKTYLKELMGKTKFHHPYEGDLDNKAEIFLAEKDHAALYEYLLSLKQDGALLKILDRYASSLPTQFQTGLPALYGEALRKKAAEACDRPAYERIRAHLEHLAKLKHSQFLVSALIAEFRTLYRRRRAFMGELNEIKVK
jgi:tetratricopeptide (TPR) repeat protein